MVLLCDADDEVAEDWLATMVGALRPGNWVAGALDYARLNSARTRRVWDAPLVPYTDRRIRTWMTHKGATAASLGRCGPSSVDSTNA